MQKRTIFGYSLQLSGSALLFPLFAWCDAAHARRSFQTIHTRSASQKGMLPPVNAQIPLLRFFQERECAFPRGSQLRQHLFLVSQEACVQRQRRLPPDQPRFHQPERQVKPFSEGNLFWSFLSNAIGAAHYSALHHDQMGHKFRGGPLLGSWFAAPLFCGNRVGSAKKAFLRRASFSTIGSIEGTPTTLSRTP